MRKFPRQVDRPKMEDSALSSAPSMGVIPDVLINASRPWDIGIAESKVENGRTPIFVE